MRSTVRIAAIVAAIVLFTTASSFTYAFYGSDTFAVQRFNLLHFGGVSFPIILAVLYFIRVAILGDWDLSPPSLHSDSECKSVQGFPNET